MIEELATQETDLKQALQQKALKESELKREKNKLLTVSGTPCIEVGPG